MKRLLNEWVSDPAGSAMVRVLVALGSAAVSCGVLSGRAVDSLANASRKAYALVGFALCVT